MPGARDTARRSGGPPLEVEDLRYVRGPAGAGTQVIALAVSCLREVIHRLGQTHTAGRPFDRETLDWLLGGELWQPCARAAFPSEVSHRLVIGHGRPHVERALLARAARTAGVLGTCVRVVRCVKGSKEAVPQLPAAFSRQLARAGWVLHVPLDLPLILVVAKVAVVAEHRGAQDPPKLLVIREEGDVDVLVAAYDLLWSATKLAAPPTSGKPLPRHLQDVVAELATGATDAVAARNLHVSERTFSRRVGEVFDHLGVTSRFEAGAVAVRRGLV